MKRSPAAAKAIQLDALRCALADAEGAFHCSSDGTYTERVARLRALVIAATGGGLTLEQRWAVVRLEREANATRALRAELEASE